MARPLEEKTTAVLEALEAFLTEGAHPTLRELAHRALVSTRDARWSLSSQVRAGRVQITGRRRVPYRNKPVAEYGLTMPRSSEAPVAALAAVLSCWRT